MSDSDDTRQNEIDDLLKQAQEAASSENADSQAEPTDADADTGTSADDPQAASVATAESTPAAGASKEQDSGKQGSSHDDINVLLQNAEAALASIDQPTAADLEGIAPFQFQDFTGEPPSSDKATLELLRDVELDLKIELGRAQMQLEDILKLRKGSVVPLDKLAGDPVDVYVNGRLVARGEVLVLNDSFCVRVAQLLAGEEAA